MNSAQYMKFRKRIGSQQKVAILVGVDIRTVQRREAGTIPITSEARRSIMSLAAREQALRLLEVIDAIPGSPGISKDCVTTTTAIRAKIEDLTALL